MKKLFLLLCSIFLMCGCSKTNNSEVINKFTNKLSNLTSYTLKGELYIDGDEQTFEYTLEVNYLKDDKYLVSMVNKANSHEQIILKNTDGLYVITPALNKSYKFESKWPDNSSQSYILKSISKDIISDSKTDVTTTENGYVITSKVNYPNNSELTYQKVYIDNEYNLKTVEVYSEDNIPLITVRFNEVNLSSNNSEDMFKLENYIKEECLENCDIQNTMGALESAIYPMYMPQNTFLNSSEVVNDENVDRIILTFSGERNFVIVEESSKVNNEHEIIPVYGDPLLLNNTIAALSNNSMYWTNNNVDYYLVSDDLSSKEMITIAESLGNYESVIGTK